MTKGFLGFFRRFWAILAACGLVGLILVLPVKTVYAALPGADASLEPAAGKQEEHLVYISGSPDQDLEPLQQARAPNPEASGGGQTWEEPSVTLALVDVTAESAETLAASDPEGPGMEADVSPAAPAADHTPEEVLDRTVGQADTEASAWLYAPQPGAEAKLYMMVRCIDNRGEPMYHQIFTIPTPAGELTARNNQTGTACLGPLAPGEYTLVTGLGTVVFTLLENGAVRCEDPLCCADGEYLTLSQTPWASLTLELGTPSRRSVTVTDGLGEVHLCLLGPDPEGLVQTPAWTFDLLPSGPVNIQWTDLDTGETGSLDLELAPGQRVTSYMTQ